MTNNIKYLAIALSISIFSIGSYFLMNQDNSKAFICLFGLAYYIVHRVK
jgi:hypothetical protein